MAKDIHLVSILTLASKLAFRRTPRPLANEPYVPANILNVLRRAANRHIPTIRLLHPLLCPPALPIPFLIYLAKHWHILGGWWDILRG